MKLKEQLQGEIDAAFLYKKLAEKYAGEAAEFIFLKMAEIEEGHAKRFLQKIQLSHPGEKAPSPSWRARLQVKIANYVGYDFILSNLAALEWRIAKSTIAKKQAAGESITGLENIHLNIIHYASKKKKQGIEGDILSKFEGKHKFTGGNALRAAVLGANDGLVSNMSLVMGVAGATTAAHTILIAGSAGLLAGSISMALGEWLSVQSARELYQKQIEIEAAELENSPEEEMRELILLYQAKGLEEKEAEKIAKSVFLDKTVALDTLAREELGIDKEVLGGSPWTAAMLSFLLFAVGAFIPLFPFFFFSFFSSFQVMVLSLALGAIGLFTMGMFITLFTGRGLFYSGIRQTVFGLCAATITYLIGKIIGLGFSP